MAGVFFGLIGSALADGSLLKASVSPVAILVHGYHPVAGQLDGLATALTAHGFAVRYFNYNWKNSLEESADRFVRFVRTLEPYNTNLVVVAHSMGGLVARRGMIKGRAMSLASDDIQINFISVAAPFGGYESANHIRYLPFNLFGIHESQRYLASRSAFIRIPGNLGTNVIHTIVETDEMDKVRCRVANCDLHNSTAVVSDAVALPINQRNAQVDSDPRVAGMYCINLGHVGVLHDQHGALSEAFHDLLFADKRAGVGRQINQISAAVK